MAGAKPRALVFPDHTADDFDPSVVVTHGNVDYTWNGYGWEVVCKGGSVDGDWVTKDEFEEALYQDVDDCGYDYIAVDTQSTQKGEIHIAEFKNEGRTVIWGPDPRFGNKPQANARVTYEDGTEYILTPFGIYGSTGGGITHDCHWNELIPPPPLGSKVDFCLIGVNPPTVYVPYDEFEADQKRQDDQTRQRDALLEAEILALAVKTTEELDKRVLKAGDTMTGDLKVEADVHANRVDSRIVDSGEKSNLQLQWDGATKVYVGESEVTVQPPLQLNTEGVDDNHAVTKAYIDALDAKQAAEINTIEYKLDALLGLTFQGTYEFKIEQDCDAAYEQCVLECFDNDPNDAECRALCGENLKDCEKEKVRPGYFEAVDPDDQFDHLEQIVISKNDKSGVEVDWSGVLDEGDYLEVDHVFQGQLDKTNYGLYRIVEEPEHGTNAYGEEVYAMKLQFLQGDGVLNQQELYEIRGITAAEGVNPEELGDFLTKTEAAATYSTIGHTHNTQYAAKTHTHSGSDITSGTVSINRLPTGTTSSTVAVGNHTHGYASSGHNHGTKYVKTGSSDSSPQDIRIYKSGSLWYIK